MPPPNVGKPVRTSLRQGGSLWYLEWTYGSTGAVTLDTTTSDLDARVATPVADSGTQGITLIRFPKCRRVRVVHCSIAAPVPLTAERLVIPTSVVPVSGSMSVLSCSIATGTTAGLYPTSGARGRLHLLLDY